MSDFEPSRFDPGGFVVDRRKCTQLLTRLRVLISERIEAALSEEDRRLFSLLGDLSAEQENHSRQLEAQVRYLTREAEDGFGSLE